MSCQLLATERAGSVVTIHGALYTRFEGQLQRTGDPVDHSRQALGLGLRKPSKDVLAARL
jgi:hypothetical protein